MTKIGEMIVKHNDQICELKLAVFEYETEIRHLQKCICEVA